MESRYFAGLWFRDLAKQKKKEQNFAKIVKILICINKQLVSELAEMILIFHNNSFQWHWKKHNKTKVIDRNELFDDCSKDILQELQQDDDIDSDEESSHAETREHGHNNYVGNWRWLKN